MLILPHFQILKKDMWIGFGRYTRRRIMHTGDNVTFVLCMLFVLVSELQAQLRVAALIYMCNLILEDFQGLVCI